MTEFSGWWTDFKSDRGGGYVSLYICQSSSNCALKRGTFYFMQITTKQKVELKSKKKIPLPPGEEWTIENRRPCPGPLMEQKQGPAQPSEGLEPDSRWR